MSAPLAEIIEEGRRLRSSYDRATEDGLDSTAHMYWDELCEFWDEHGPLLLRVAEAAVEMREATKFYFGRHSIESDADGGSVRLANATAAFDAAVRGGRP